VRFYFNILADLSHKLGLGVLFSCASLMCIHPFCVRGCDPQGFAAHIQQANLLFMFQSYRMQMAYLNSCWFWAYLLYFSDHKAHLKSLHFPQNWKAL